MLFNEENLMYEKLKQIMREAGYAVSEGGEWLATDMRHFVTFSRHVLGETTPHLNHLLAYPQAFPNVAPKLVELSETLTLDVSEPVVQPAVDAPAEPVAEPQPVVQEPAATEQQSSGVLDVSATGQSEKQDLSAAQDPVAQGSTQGEQPAQGAEGEQPAQGAEGEQPSGEQEQGAEQAEKPAGDESAEGEQPQE